MDKTANKKKSDVDLKKMDSMATRVVYWVFVSLIVVTLITSIVLLCIGHDVGGTKERQIENILLSSAALIVFNIPSFIKWKFHLYIPTVLQVFTLIFIFAHFIMGEVQGIYKLSASYDKILHTTSGLAIATIGFSLVNLLNVSNNTHLKLSPIFVAIFAFCFAIAIAVMWEIFEYAADSILGMNMQRYDPPANAIKPVPPKQGYGLLDTMGDLIVSTIAAAVVCILGYISLKTKKNYLNRFLLRKIPSYEVAIEEAREAGDKKLVAVIEKARAETIKEGDEEKNADIAMLEAEESVINERKMSGKSRGNCEIPVSGEDIIMSSETKDDIDAERR